MSISLVNGVFWVGAVDWNIKNFHGHTYNTNRGTTYNSYLIIDEKIALIDTVYAPFTKEFIERIKEIIPPEKIDYIIANHVETDHSGALPELMKYCPNAKIFCTAKCKEGLYRYYYGDWNFQIVKTGDTLNLGKRTLSFIEAPMIHWPDSMFTYCKEEKLLMPNDAFGQHYATSKRFDDEVDQSILMDEAEKYYANILWPLGTIIQKKLEEIQKMNLPIDIIAPSHGIIWRKDPAKIVNSYISWVKNETKSEAVIVYETMWGATEKMARKIADGIISEGIKVRLFDIAQSDRTEIIKAMFNAKGYLIGSSTHDNDMLPTIAGFMDFLKGLRPKSRIGCSFGSHGWAGGGAKNLESLLKESGVEIVQPVLTLQYMPSVEDFSKCYEFGKEFAKKLK